MNKDKDNITHIEDVREVVANAERIISREVPAGTTDIDDHGGGHDEIVKNRQNDLPGDCPVVPLGREVQNYYYLDANQQLITLKAEKHGRLNIQSLFGSKIPWLYCQPRYVKTDKKGNVQSWAPEKVAEDLMSRCAEEGIFNAMERLRGAGCWRSADGALVYHAGDQVLIDGEWQSPGIIGRHVYSAASPGPRPSRRKPPSGERGPAREILTLFESWNWERPAVDPMLLLGWIGAAMLGGALKWRPLCWITGDKATGKSTLHEIIHGLFDDDGIISVTDATAAGLWQKLGHATLPVAFDEIEAEQDNRQANNVIKLARQAASGGLVLRGGSDHGSAEFKARSCFLFSSILIPPLLSQDLSRMAILSLKRLPVDARPPVINIDQLHRIGEDFRRKLMDEWPRFAETLALYQYVLTEAGHGGRGADQFGTLLACADLLLYDMVPDSDSLALWQDRLQTSSMLEKSEEVSDAEQCIAHLLTSVVNVYRHGEQRTVAEWLYWLKSDNQDKASDAKRSLGNVGIKYREPVADDPAGILIANAHRGLSDVYQATHWAGRSGTAGVWVQSLRRLDGARPMGPQRFGYITSRATFIPLDSINHSKLGAYDDDDAIA